MRRKGSQANGIAVGIILAVSVSNLRHNEETINVRSDLVGEGNDSFKETVLNFSINPTWNVLAKLGQPSFKSKPFTKVLVRN
jgi:hypothetical protein